mmetsp:Transcript_20918/g.30304  ORF Transcript_20918/g.30304 Transcript_20918/m.30304 type:complete len:309 (-) Transcript_20918:299-1225(-)
MAYSVNNYGQKYQDIFHFFPAIEPFYGGFEKDFNSPLESWIFTNGHPYFPVYCSVLYLVLIFGGMRLMRDRKPFDLRWALALWNLMLSLFSFIGASRVVPHLFLMLKEHGIQAMLCSDSVQTVGSGVCGFWTYLFILSKVPELFDTFFIVVRKRKLIFLHWYHHVTVLLYCWHSYLTKSTAGIFFVGMNYSVHAIMYFYYFLSACRIRVWWLPDWFVTMCQTSQMFVGVALCVLGYGLYQTEGTWNGSSEFLSDNSVCAVKWDNIVSGAVMYASYFYLFLAMAVGRYFAKGKKSGDKSKKSNGKPKVQ